MPAYALRQIVAQIWMPAPGSGWCQPCAGKWAPVSTAQLARGNTLVSTSSPGLTATAADEARSNSDLDLLRAYEPIVRYTQGELFFPTAVGPYTAQCSLWAGVPDGDSEQIVAAGALTLERLCEHGRQHQSRPRYMRFVEEPLGRREYRRWRRSSPQRLSTGGRLTTTGIPGRLIDAGFRASLLVRGKVPSGLTAAADSIYRERLEADHFTYYGRVVRQGGYICLQYWFFYAMNDWRSTFHGINDHEADWEMATIYLADRSGGRPEPVWAAFSSHDYHGDDLRRRWDDPDIMREGDHVVLFAGAGSHSGVFVPGDYVVRVDPPQLRAALRLLRRVQRFPRRRRSSKHEAGFGIPFVDYARGDGVTIGAGSDATWTPVLIDEETSWVRDYRGLWGLDTRDRFGGERAPAGPRYERDGSVRSAWANPLGWAGLLKIPPTDEEVAPLLSERVTQLDAKLAELDSSVHKEQAALRRARAEARSLAEYGPTRALAATRWVEVEEREAALNESLIARTGLAEERTAHLGTLSRPLPREPPRAHISKPHEPLGEGQDARPWLLQLWAKVSIPLLLGCIVIALTASPLALATTIVVIGIAFMAVEAVARRRFASFVLSLTLTVGALLAFAALVLLFLAHWRLAVSVLIGAAALLLLVGNLLRG
jgi:hypothetical protein